MATLVIPNTLINGTIVDAVALNTNFAAIPTVVNALDYTNIGTTGLTASNLKPTTTAQATFGGTVGYLYQSPAIGITPLTVNGITGQTADILDVELNSVKYFVVTSTGAVQLTQLAAASAQTLQIDTSGNISGVNVYQVQTQQANANYSTTSGDTTSSPGTVVSMAVTLGTSALTNWQVDVEYWFNFTNTPSSVAGVLCGIGASTAGTSPVAQYASPASAHRITGGSCVSDGLVSTVASVAGSGSAGVLKYSATYANAATPTFTGLWATGSANITKINGTLIMRAFPV